jgi:hypothetical protein
MSCRNIDFDSVKDLLYTNETTVEYNLGQLVISDSPEKNKRKGREHEDDNNNNDEILEVKLIGSSEIRIVEDDPFVDMEAIEKVERGLLQERSVAQNVVPRPSTSPKKKKKAPRGEITPDGMTVGWWPNFKYGKLLRSLLETGNRYFPTESPIRSDEELYKALQIKNPEKERIPIQIANLVYRNLEQRSKAWFTVRKLKNIDVTGNDRYQKFLIGASSIAAMTGLWCKRAKKYFKGEQCKYGDNQQFREVWIEGLKKVFDRKQRTFMEWGFQKEPDVLIANIQNRPDFKFREIGTILLPLLKSEHLRDPSLRDTIEPNIIISVSPDAYSENIKTGEIFSEEFKAPHHFDVTLKGYFRYWAMAPYPLQPEYYCGQELAQCVGLHYALDSSRVAGSFFSCLTVQDGLKCWKREIDWELWDIQMKVMEWAFKKYYIDKDRVPINDSDFDPFQDCEFYDDYLLALKKHQMTYERDDTYEVKDEWVEPGFQCRFFDDEDGEDLRESCEEWKEKFADCSAEKVPKEADENDLRQTTLNEF